MNEPPPFPAFHFTRPSGPGFAIVSEGCAAANEWMAFYMLRLLESLDLKDLASTHWFSLWRDAYLRFYQPIFAAYTYTLSEGRTCLLAKEPSADRVLALFDTVQAALPDLLNGRPIEDLLLASENIPLWERYFNIENQLYQMNNQWLAQCIQPLVKPGDVLLEVGGGFGSAALTLARTLTPTQREQAHLVFSEIVPFFMSRARRALGGQFAKIDYKMLDLNHINEPPSPGQFDLIYGVNVLHVAQDLESTLARLYQWLQPGGSLVFSEAVRPFIDVPIYPEMVFGFFRDFHQVHLSDLRPKGGFLTQDHWKALLVHQGFQVDTWPKSELGPEYPFIYSTCLVAQKPK